MSDPFAPDDFAQLHCDVCGHSFARDDLVEFQGSTMCGPCKRETVGRMEAGQSPTAVLGGDLPPWERRDEIGLVSAFFLTIKEVVVEPGAFFERMDKTSNRRDCLVFAALVTAVTAGAGWLLQTAIMTALGAAGAAADGSADPLIGMIGMQGAMGCVAVVVSPLAGILRAYVSAGCIHLFLSMTNKSAAPFHQTLRGTCYASSPAILQAVPLVGAVGWLYLIVCEIFMVMRLHRVSGGVATLAVLWILFVGCCLGFGAFFMVLGAGAAAGGM